MEVREGRDGGSMRFSIFPDQFVPLVREKQKHRRP